MNGWLIFLALLLAYLGVLMFLKRREQPLPGGFEVNGPFIFWRTQFGKPALRRIARAERFWNVVADVGIIATWIVGGAIFALLIYSLTLYFTAPEVVAQSATEPQFLIGLPGVNPLIPVGYGFAALIVALVIHEGSHGVMAYVGRMRVKSLGLLMFIVPVGAFVEPDEEDLEKASTRAKNRVFAAGPASNLVVAILCGVLLTGMLSGVTMANGGQGLGIGNVVPDSPADDAMLRQGDILVGIDDVQIVSGAQFTEVMNATRAGQRVTVDYLRGGESRQTVVTLADKSTYTGNATHAGKGFLGMGNVPLSVDDPTSAAARYLTPAGRLSVTTHPFQDGPLGSFALGDIKAGKPPGSFMIYVSLPFAIFATGMDAFAAPYRDFLVIEGPLAGVSPAFFFGTATLLYWIVWINIMLGTFNALPAGPLDGGQIFKATLRERLMRRYAVDRTRVNIRRGEVGGILVEGADDETQQKLDRIQGVMSRTTWTLGLFILMLIVLPLFGPQLVSLFI